MSDKNCKICGADFVNKRNLNRHIITHQPKKVHFCPLCHCGISRRDHLVDHMVRQHKLERHVAKEKCQKIAPTVLNDSTLSSVNVQPTTSAESDEVDTVIRMRRKPNEHRDRIITVTALEDRGRKRHRAVAEVCFYFLSTICN